MLPPAGGEGHQVLWAGEHAVGNWAVVLIADEYLHMCIVTLVSFFLTDLVVTRGSKPSVVSPGTGEGSFTCQMESGIII